LIGPTKVRLAVNDTRLESKLSNSWKLASSELWHVLVIMAQFTLTAKSPQLRVSLFTHFQSFANACCVWSACRHKSSVSTVFCCCLYFFVYCQMVSAECCVRSFSFFLAVEFLLGRIFFGLNGRV